MNSKSLTPEGPEVRYSVHRTNPRLFGASQHLPTEDWLKLVATDRPDGGTPDLIPGPIASGDKVVAFKDVLERYHSAWPKLVGVEMEAGGAASAAFQRDSPPGFFMIRGVSDLADEKKNEEEVRQWRSYAADVAAAFTIALLSSGPVPVSASSQSSKGRNNKEPDAEQKLLAEARRVATQLPNRPLIIEPDLRQTLIETLARTFTTRRKIDVLMGEAFHIQLPFNIEDPSKLFEVIIIYCEEQGAEYLAWLMNKAIQLQPQVPELKQFRALLVDRGSIPNILGANRPQQESRGRLDEITTGGRYVVNGEYVDANSDPVNPPAHFAILDQTPDTTYSAETKSSGSNEAQGNDSARIYFPTEQDNVFVTFLDWIRSDHVRNVVIYAAVLGSIVAANSGISNLLSAKLEWWQWVLGLSAVFLAVVAGLYMGWKIMGLWTIGVFFSGLVAAKLGPKLDLLLNKFFSVLWQFTGIATDKPEETIPTPQIEIASPWEPMATAILFLMLVVFAWWVARELATRGGGLLDSLIGGIFGALASILALSQAFDYWADFVRRSGNNPSSVTPQVTVGVAALHPPTPW